MYGRGKVLSIALPVALLALAVLTPTLITSPSDGPALFRAVSGSRVAAGGAPAFGVSDAQGFAPGGVWPTKWILRLLFGLPAVTFRLWMRPFERGRHPATMSARPEQPAAQDEPSSLDMAEIDRKIAQMVAERHAPPATPVPAPATPRASFGRRVS